MSLTLSFPQFPQFTINIHKLASVKNGQDLRAKLLAGEPTHNFAFINAQTVVSVEQLSAAIYRAILDYTGDRIRTRTLHSECIFALSPTQNIVDALKRYGIQDDSEDLIVVKVIEDGKDDPAYDLSVVEGEEVTVSDDELQKTANIALIKKVSKGTMK
ncbi:hypothetical protein BON22_2952 [Cyberlindnera fabianii]|uniref:EKC/KEOPS complex subunit CGI121 n=1 Tax=Cyberlindnera fabianii TaxID=36022 RepID=A0A1V2L5L6_CYBFA|nr:hypothetical protein BON22_2952 [Cyberlindnera fabianii]